MYDCKAAEKRQENGAVHTEDQPVSISSSTASVMSTSTITTASRSTVTVSVESQPGAHNRKVTCSQSGTDLTVHNSDALPSTSAVTTVHQSRSSSGPSVTHLPLKPLFQLHGGDKPSAEKAKTAQQQASSCPLRTTDSNPQISMKMAKSRRGQKIGQAQDIPNLAPQSAGAKNCKQPVATSSCPSLLPASAVASRCALPVGSHTSESTKSQVETSSKVVTRLPNGLAAAGGKAYPNVDRLSQTSAASLHGNSTKPTLQLPNGLHVHADRSPTKTSHLSGNPHCGSKLGTGVANGPSSGYKTSRKTDNITGEENGHVKSSETGGQCPSLADVGLLVNGHADQMTTASATKSKKARRKGRGKAALTSVG